MWTLGTYRFHGVTAAELDQAQAWLRRAGATKVELKTGASSKPVSATQVFEGVDLLAYFPPGCKPNSEVVPETLHTVLVWRVFEPCDPAGAGHSPLR